MPGNPHDALFRKTFSDVSNAAAELRAVLPAAVLRCIDLSTLRLVSGTFVDTELVAAESDLLFSVELGAGSGFLHLLCEHQRTLDPLMAFRVLKYVVRILDRHVAAAPSRTS